MIDDLFHDMVVGRKDIIAFLKIPLALSSNASDAWRKLYRLRSDKGMERLFHHDFLGRPFILKSEIAQWIAGFSYSDRRGKNLLAKKKCQKEIKD